LGAADKFKILEHFENYESFVHKNTNPEKVCFLNHNHVEKNCRDYGACNHLHPSRMSKMDKHVFKTNYPKNMTLQDYVNWLWLHKNDGHRDRLTKDHLTNLEKLEKGDAITYQMIPQLIDRPISDVYYKRLNTNEEMIQDYSPIGYNYVEYSEYKSPSFIKLH